MSATASTEEVLRTPRRAPASLNPTPVSSKKASLTTPPPWPLPNGDFSLLYPELTPTPMSDKPGQ